MIQFNRQNIYPMLGKREKKIRRKEMRGRKIIRKEFPLMLLGWRKERKWKKKYFSLFAWIEKSKKKKVVLALLKMLFSK